MEMNIDYDFLINAAKTLDKDSLKVVLEKMLEIQVNDISYDHYASKCKKCSKKFKDDCDHYWLFRLEFISCDSAFIIDVDRGNIEHFTRCINNEQSFISDGIHVGKNHLDISIDSADIQMFKIGEKNMKILKQKIYDIIKNWIK